MKKISLLIGLCLFILGCDNFKTTKELCQIDGTNELIQQRIMNSSILNEEIKKAIEQEDVPFIHCLVKNGYDGKYDDGKTLMLAIEQGWEIKEIEPLIKQTQKYTLDSALLLACRKGNMDLVKTLITNGASINSLSSWTGVTPLSSAVSSGNLELVKFLIESGAGKKLGNSPLAEALKLKDKDKANEIANYLLGIGVKYSFEDLVVASEEGMTNIVKKLLSLQISPTADWNTYTPLMAASKGGHTDIIKILLKTNAGKKYKGDWKKCNGRYVYLSMGLDQTQIKKEYNGWYLTNALLYAVESRNVEAAKLLLEAGSDPNYDTSYICEEDIMPKLPKDNSWGAYELYTKEMKFFNNAPKGICLLTPLMIASRQGNTEMIKLLVKYGADINKQCYVGATAFSSAKNEETRNLLAQLGASR